MSLTEATITTISEDIKEETSETSDDGLKIDFSPKKKKPKLVTIDSQEKQVIDTIEQQMERNLDEKASKSNLTATNVKNILKHLVSNEHVLAMLRHTEDPDSSFESAYEPKLTRAKAK